MQKYKYCCKKVSEIVLRYTEVLLHFILLLPTQPVVLAMYGHTHLSLQGLQAGLADVVPDVLSRQKLLELLEFTVGLNKDEQTPIIIIIIKKSQVRPDVTTSFCSNFLLSDFFI